MFRGYSFGNTPFIKQTENESGQRSAAFHREFFMRTLSAVFLFLVMALPLPAYKIQIVKSPVTGWTLTDDSGNPFLMRGVCYSPTPIGRGVWDVNLYSDDPSIRFVDAEKMQLMGVNTLRIYHPGRETEGTQKFIRQLHNLYSIYTLFPLPLEMQGADFSSKNYLASVRKQILRMVRDYKDTPGIIVWLIGNEIDYFFTDDKAFWDNKEIRAQTSPFRKSVARAKIVLSFVNELAREIKAIDPNHPVGVSLGKQDYFNILAETIPDVDFVGLNFYQGKTFSSVWSQARRFDKPVLITEFGIDAWNTKKDREDEDTQAKFLVSLWKDIERNSAVAPVTKPNAMAIGGCIFEWTDEWWKAEGGNPSVQETAGQWVNPSWPDFVEGKPNVQEEWFGIIRIEKCDNGGIDRRIPRKAYDSFKELWNPASVASRVAEKSGTENPTPPEARTEPGSTAVKPPEPDVETQPDQEPSIDPDLYEDVTE